MAPELAVVTVEVDPHLVHVVEHGLSAVLLEDGANVGLGAARVARRVVRAVAVVGPLTCMRVEKLYEHIAQEKRTGERNVLLSSPMSLAHALDGVSHSPWMVNLFDGPVAGL